jgi:hypothetical protein
MTEEWRDVVGYKGRYMVSSLGRVKSLPNKIRRSERILKTGIAKKLGYPTVALIRDEEGRYRQRTFYVHRLVLEAFVGPCPNGMECRHGDGNRANPHLDNLCWGTVSSNQMDRIGHGTSNRGEKNGRSALTTGDVMEIKRRVGKEKDASIAKDFGVHEFTIAKIRRGETWAWVDAAL